MKKLDLTKKYYCFLYELEDLYETDRYSTYVEVEIKFQSHCGNYNVVEYKNKRGIITTNSISRPQRRAGINSYCLHTLDEIKKIIEDSEPQVGDLCYSCNEGAGKFKKQKLMLVTRKSKSTIWCVDTDSGIEHRRRRHRIIIVKRKQNQ